MRRRRLLCALAATVAACAAAWWGASSAAASPMMFSRLLPVASKYSMLLLFATSTLRKIAPKPPTVAWVALPGT